MRGALSYCIVCELSEFNHFRRHHISETVNASVPKALRKCTRSWLAMGITPKIFGTAILSSAVWRCDS